MTRIVIEYVIEQPEGLRLPTRCEYPANLTRAQVFALLREAIYADQCSPTLPPEEA
jgi:hypothetical protein